MTKELNHFLKRSPMVRREKNPFAFQKHLMGDGCAKKWSKICIIKFRLAFLANIKIKRFFGLREISGFAYLNNTQHVNFEYTCIFAQWHFLKH